MTDKDLDAPLRRRADAGRRPRGRAGDRGRALGPLHRRSDRGAAHAARGRAPAPAAAPALAPACRTCDRGLRGRGRARRAARQRGRRPDAAGTGTGTRQGAAGRARIVSVRSTSAHDYDPQRRTARSTRRRSSGRRPRPEHLVDDRELPATAVTKAKRTGRRRASTSTPSPTSTPRDMEILSRRRAGAPSSMPRPTAGPDDAPATSWKQVGGGTRREAQAALRAQHRRQALPLLPGLDHRAAAGRQPGR